MEEILTDFEIELSEVKNLITVLDNAINYYMESRSETDHIHTFSGYVNKRMELLCENFESICSEYYTHYK